MHKRQTVYDENVKTKNRKKKSQDAERKMRNHSEVVEKLFRFSERYFTFCCSRLWHHRQTFFEMQTFAFSSFIPPESVDKPLWKLICQLSKKDFDCLFKRNDFLMNSEFKLANKVTVATNCTLVHVICNEPEKNRSAFAAKKKEFTHRLKIVQIAHVVVGRETSVIKIWNYV